MKVNSKIWRITLLVLWVILGSAVIVLFVAAVNVKTNKNCRGYLIEISGAEDFMFLDKDDLVKIITKNGADALRGKPLAAIDLHQLELAIATNVWVRKAELFFDNNLLLHINVIEREPVARVFTEAGTSFYIDSSGSRLPLSSKMSVKLPVFTNFPEAIGKWNKRDSALVKDVRVLSNLILHNEFWMAQVAQVNCEAEGTFEIVPVVGNHRILFGTGEDAEKKFKRLLLFYQQILSKAGIDRYSMINVSYKDQVVATRPTPRPLVEPIKFTSPTDSMRLENQIADISSSQHLNRTQHEQ